MKNPPALPQNTSKETDPFITEFKGTVVTKPVFRRTKQGREPVGTKTVIKADPLRIKLQSTSTETPRKFGINILGGAVQVLGELVPSKPSRRKS